MIDPRPRAYGPFVRLAAIAVGLTLVAVLVMQPASALGAPPAALLDAVADDLAARTGTEPAAIELLRSEAVTWNDGCLGAAEPDEACTEALVDGFVLWLRAGEAAYRYHTDSAQTFRFAAGPLALDEVDEAPLPAGATPRTFGFIGELPAAGGVALVTWSGGSVDALAEAAPAATSFWVTVDGDFLGYLPAAPAFVNAAFVALFPDGQIPAGTHMLVALPRPAHEVPTGEPIALRYGFSEGELGWEAGFSDYGPEFEMELDSGIAPLPASLEQEGQGFRITGFNRTDDLFMFLKRGIGTAEGIEPGQSYRVSYRIVFASDAPTGCFGVGGPPGEAVWLKAGVVAVEPDVELIDNYWHLTVDKDNQASGGEDVWLVGDIANGIECEEAIEAGYPYAEVEREYTHDEVVTATDDGELWLIVGTDSGFEGRTELFYMVIEVTLKPVEP